MKIQKKLSIKQLKKNIQLIISYLLKKNLNKNLSNLNSYQSKNNSNIAIKFGITIRLNVTKSNVIKKKIQDKIGNMITLYIRQKNKVKKNRKESKCKKT